MRSCVQSAVGMLRDQVESGFRSTRRVEILLTLLTDHDETNGTNGLFGSSSSFFFEPALCSFCIFEWCQVNFFRLLRGGYTCCCQLKTATCMLSITGSSKKQQTLTPCKREGHSGIFFFYPTIVNISIRLCLIDILSGTPFGSVFKW